MTVKDSPETTTVEDVDAQALQEAQIALGSSSPQDAVNEALREAVRKRIVKNFLDFMSSADLERADTLRNSAWQKSAT